MTPEKCRVCGRQMIPQRKRSARRTIGRPPAAKPVGVVEHGGRGLCRTDYQKARETDTLDDFERCNYTRAEVIQAFRELRPPRSTKQDQIADVAAKIGMTFDALDQALHRARRDGVTV